MSSYRILGLMSGTSLDGLDIVDVLLSKVSKDQWTFEVLHAETVDYSEDWQFRLGNSANESGIVLTQLSHDLGNYFGDAVNDFLARNAIRRDDIAAISSHGHTVFHQPKEGYTLQIGNGPELAHKTGLLTVCDFRVNDVLLGGNGAPLVPVGDQFLFSSSAESFLNLGGFSNISFQEKGTVLAFDICPVNIVLNKLAEQVGQRFDNLGRLGREGVIDRDVLSRLNELPFYSEAPPKSLGAEWVADEIHPIIGDRVDLITTFYEHVAQQIAAVLTRHKLSSVFLSGGGAKNQFLLERLKSHYGGAVILPDSTIIEFKEAIVFALLGVLRLREEINVWCSVTGARRDSVSGVIHNPSL